MDNQVHGKMCEFSALTCIDTASNLVELICIDNRTAKHIHNKFMQSWLKIYTHPSRCVYIFNQDCINLLCICFAVLLSIQINSTRLYAVSMHVNRTPGKSICAVCEQK